MSDDPFQLSADRYDLQARYLDLTRVELPAAARKHGWPITEDHCFMRVILDALFEGCWYDHLDRRLRAYKQLDTAQLGRAIALGQRMLDEGEPTVTALNRQSLRWREKL